MAQQSAEHGETGTGTGAADASRNGGKSKKAFRTISEVAGGLDVPQHVLRFWETKFNQVRPMKRGGNRRYYRPEDVELLSAIRHFLYTDGYTIKGVQKLIKDNGIRKFVDLWDEEKDATVVEASADSTADSASGAADDTPAAKMPGSMAQRSELEAVLRDLKALRKTLIDE